jgi:hypothetical protein
MITGELKSKVDKVWDAFANGGISNPLEVIEQITYLLFIKRLDDLHTAKERQANITKREIVKPIFNGEQQDYRWSRFKNEEAGEAIKNLSFEFYEIQGKIKPIIYLEKEHEIEIVFEKLPNPLPETFSLRIYYDDKLGYKNNILMTYIFKSGQWIPDETNFEFKIK